MKNIVLLGGAFNPVHNGHISAMKALLSTDKFDEGWFLPVSKDPFNVKHLARSDHRIKMLEIAKHGYVEMKVNLFELINTIDNTYQMMRDIHRYYKNHKFTFAMGMDQANSIKEWQCWEKLIDIYDLVVLNRTGVVIEEDSKVIANKHIVIDNNIPDISSTTIRALLKDGKEVPTDIISKDVLEYINKEGLYIT